MNTQISVALALPSKYAGFTTTCSSIHSPFPFILPLISENCFGEPFPLPNLALLLFSSNTGSSGSFYSGERMGMLISKYQESIGSWAFRLVSSVAGVLV